MLQSSEITIVHLFSYLNIQLMNVLFMQVVVEYQQLNICVEIKHLEG